MSVTLQNGCGDLSRELGEATPNVTTPRLNHYNDAVIDFANERKFPFLIKENATITTDGNALNRYSISAITDIRQPGGIKEITLGTSTEPILPIDWSKRNDAQYVSGNFFYITPDELYIVFTKTVTTGQLIHMWYYYIPARTTDLAGTFPIPDRYRKVVATLAAAYVQWGRYLDGQGNRLFNLYNKRLAGVVDQQSEENTGNPKRIQHYLKYVGFKRKYP